MECSPSSGLMFAIVIECVMDIDASLPRPGRQADFKDKQKM
jgi:hypothetical protein